MIDPFPEWKEVLDSHKKKDDLADSFLQECITIMKIY